MEAFNLKWKEKVKGLFKNWFGLKENLPNNDKVQNQQPVNLNQKDQSLIQQENPSYVLSPMQQKAYWQNEQSIDQNVSQLHRQEEHVQSHSWTQEFDEIKTQIIQRDNQFRIVPIVELQKGDFLLERNSEDLSNEKGAMIAQRNLLVRYLDNQFIKYGEVIKNQREEVYPFSSKNIVEYKDLLTDYKIDKQLVPKEQETFSLKEFYYYAAMHGSEGIEKKALIDKAMQRNGELDNMIGRTLSLNQLSAGETYKVIDFIEADGEALSNKILYLEDEKGNTKSYGIGKQLDSIDYQKGETIQLENVLRNSVSLLEKSCQNIEKRREVEISQEVAMER